MCKFMFGVLVKISGWGTDTWCRPSCIPTTVILSLLVLEHSNSVAGIDLRQQQQPECTEQCRVSLVETIPEGVFFPLDATRHQETQKVWLNLIQSATNTIEIATYFWNIRENEPYPDNSSIKGEEVFQALLQAGTKRGLTVKIVQSAPIDRHPNTDTKELLKKKAAEVRNVDFPKLLGSGLLHTKLFLVDRTHFFIGSANMDWRSLTETKELGIVGYNCSCLTQDIAKIFEVYWSLGKEDAVIPDEWPVALQTTFNRESPFNVSLSGHRFNTYISSSPSQLNPQGRTDDLDVILNVIETAEKFVYASVSEYYPLTKYRKKKRFWPFIDNALRTAAIEANVQVRLIISWWNNTNPDELKFLESLAALSGSYSKVDIQIKRFVIPPTTDKPNIPFIRVNHNKFMVSDKVAYIGTSNWSGDYFKDSTGAAIIMQEPDNQDAETNVTEVGMRKQLQQLFERDWDSPYAVPLNETVDFI